MSVIEAIILGLIQGLAEFLPISSSGHLLLFQKIFGLNDVPMFFTIMLHIGTLFAVCIALRKELAAIFRKPLGKMTWMIVLATVPTVIIAVLFKLLLGDAFDGAYLGFGFMITGIALYCMELFPAGSRSLEEITVKDALFMGVAQGFGTLPGISRSGSTIVGGSFGGLSRDALARFSFLMSIPAILGALVLDIKDVDFAAISAGSAGVSWPCIIIGTIVAGVSGYFAVKWLLKLITKRSMRPFAYYTFVLGVLVTVDIYFTHIVFK